MMQLATSTGTTGDANAVSKEKVWYRSGGEVFAMVSMAFIDGGVAGCVNAHGLTDGIEGFYIGFNGTAFSTFSITGGVETAVATASWNGDKCDASATSRFTRAGTPEAIDHTKLNVWRIRFGWLGAAPIKYEVLSPDGEWITVHTLRQPNTSATPSLLYADLPMRSRVLKTSGATNVRANVACWGAGLTYDKKTLVGSATLGTTVSNAVTLPVIGLGALTVTLGTGTTGTAIFEASVDGASWVTHPSCWLLGAVGVADTLVTAAVTGRVPKPGEIGG
jgi:hypothetical protein